VGISVLFGGGVDYHIVKMEQNTDIDQTLSGFSVLTDDILKASGTGIGYKAFIGLDWSLSSFFGLTFQGGYRFGKIKELKATEDFITNSAIWKFNSGDVIKKDNTDGTAFDGDNLTIDLAAPYVFVGLVFTL